MLKILRVVFALLFFIPIIFLFLDFAGLYSWGMVEGLTFLQFTPSILKCIAFSGLVAFGFIVVLIITMLWGRVYCSVICPIGILQDIISRVVRKFKRKKIWRFSKANNIIRYGLTLVVIASVLFGSTMLLTLLDPYSNFGRIVSTLVRPIYFFFNNGIVKILESKAIYELYQVTWHPAYWFVYVVPIIYLLIIIVMASYRGRLFCNTLCPVGGVLSIFSKISLFKIEINKNACTLCGKCSAVCKSQCIDFKKSEIDFSRCVACYNCVGVCSEKGIGYKLQKPLRIRKTESIPSENGRRKFFAKAVSIGAGLSLISNSSNVFGADKNDKVDKKPPVSPPGSKGINHFMSKCTACQLCVSACPTQVLQPSFTEYGLMGMMQPHMDFKASFCNYECVRCTEVCPTGAILPLDKKQKKLTQPGYVVFEKEKCIVFVKDKACGACSEHCPTKAVNMVFYKKGLTIPETNKDICVGCGACEYACPTNPKAIIVKGNEVHKVVKLPTNKALDEVAPTEFPF